MESEDLIVEDEELDEVVLDEEFEAECGMKKNQRFDIEDFLYEEGQDRQRVRKNDKHGIRDYIA